MKKVILISWQLYNSKTKIGFHWLASAFYKMGWDVVFVTTQISIFSIRKDSRFKISLIKNLNKLVRVNEKLTSYIHFTFFHYVNHKNNFLNRSFSNLYPYYGKRIPKNLTQQIKESSLLIFDSTSSIQLIDELKKINPSARFVYRVSDDIRLFNNPRFILDREYEIASKFNLVSTPSNYIYNKFKLLPNVRLHYHGIEKKIFDQVTISPYQKGINAVFVGKNYFDHGFLEIASDIFPDVDFHIIGPIQNLPMKKNIIGYGEIPFVETVPFVKHADLGLHTLAKFPHGESFTDTLKVIQYTYNRLPIVAPDFLKTEREHMFYYKTDDRITIKKAMEMAIQYDRKKIKTDDILTWEEVAQELI